MAGDQSTFGDLDGRRDYSRVALVIVTLLAVLLATMALPALSPAGTDTPASSLVPIPEQLRQGGGSGSGSGGDLGGLGALSPGDQTQVGGSLGGESALRSTSDEVHFRVRSTQPSYWRTGAYGGYTGEGWEQRDETSPVEGSIPVPGQRDTEVTYEVTLARGATALPTVWQPSQLSRQGVAVTANGAVRADRTVPAGTSYTGVSYQPPDDPALLRQAGREYPAAIEERYTQLPADRPERLARFTDELTANASTAYGEARAIEQFLEADKTYSLNASHDPDSPEDIATQFVFDMDQGYCEYFATSMVAMLRTQDVPARYVVGYSTGEEVSENTYEVRGMNAHAWVEVYFPDVGWVRFDPTPSDARRQAEAEELGQDTPTPTPTATPTPTPSPTPTPTPTPTATPTPPTPAENTTTSTPSGSTPTPTPTTPTESEDGYQIALDPEPTPGATVTVTVTESGVPVADARVLFNGELVGVTTTEGNVTGEVPYTRSLNVTIDGNANQRVIGHGVPTGENGRLFRPAQPRAYNTETFELNTTARLVLSGSIHTGSEIGVTALVSGEPVPEATVTVDGTRVGTTDERGWTTLTLPTDPGETTLAVERGAVSGNRTLTLGELNATVESTTPLALPFTDVRVNATVAGQPTAGAAVTVGGEQVATTGVDGTATVSLPLNASATVGVSRYGQTRTATISGLYTNLGIVVGVGLLALAVTGTLARRASIGPRRIARWLVRAGRGVVAALVALAGLLDRALSRCHRRVLLTVDHLRDLLARRTTPAALVAAFRAWLDERASEAEETLAAGMDAVPALGGNGDEESVDAHTTIREGWSGFLDHVSLVRPERRTPEAIAAHAVEVDDLPAEAVWTLVDAFRAVEYGQRDPGERVPAVDEALAAIERSVAQADGSTDDPPEGADADGGTGVAD